MRRVARALLALLLLCGALPGQGFAARTVERAERRRHQHRTGATTIPLQYRDHAQRLVLVVIAVPAPQRPLLVLAPTFYEFHAGRVRRDFLSFSVLLPGHNPAMRRRSSPSDSDGRALSFVPLSEAEDPLRELRALDRLQLFRVNPAAASPDAVAAGVALFIGAMVSAAHAPAPLRFLFDGPVRLGPAIFQGSGMGAGVGGTFP